jgi:hypothetical protein
VHEPADDLEVLAFRILQLGAKESLGDVIHEHWCAHIRWMHRVHPNTMLPQIDGECRHHPDEAVFGSGVAAGPGVSLQSANRAVDDDRTTECAGKNVGSASLRGFPYAG